MVFFRCISGNLIEGEIFIFLEVIEGNVFNLSVLYIFKIFMIVIIIICNLRWFLI